MSQGFAIGVNVATADELTGAALAQEVEAQGQLTALESQVFLPASIVAAQSMMNAIGAGPFWVWFDGADNLASPGETTTLRITVSSVATPAPSAGGSPAPQTPSVASEPPAPVEAEAAPEATPDPATTTEAVA